MGDSLEADLAGIGTAYGVTQLDRSFGRESALDVPLAAQPFQAEGDSIDNAQVGKKSFRECLKKAQRPAEHKRHRGQKLVASTMHLSFGIAWPLLLILRTTVCLRMSPPSAPDAQLARGRAFGEGPGDGITPPSGRPLPASVA